MILNHDFVASIEAKCNQLECCECGKYHAVKLEWEDDVIFQNYLDDDFCRGFREQVDNLIKTEIMRRITDPFPFLK